MIFNLPGVKNERHSLRLTRDAVVGIFNGTIRWWNDSLLVNSNPDIKLPDMPLKPLARADHAGTTEIFTGALSKFSEAWSEVYGVFCSGLGNDSEPLRWKKDVIYAYGYTDIGMAGLLLSTPYSIGYISSSSVQSYNLPVADVENKQGNFIYPCRESVLCAVKYGENSIMPYTLPRWTWLNITDSDAEMAYPIVGYTYIVIPKKDLACEAAVEFYRYVNWFLNSEDAQYSVGKADMAYVGNRVSNAIVHCLDTGFYCEGNTLVFPLVQRQLEKELPREDWEIWLTVVIAVLVFLLFLTSLYAIHQRYKVSGHWHYNNVIMTTMASQITSIFLYWDADQRHFTFLFISPRQGGHCQKPTGSFPCGRSWSNWKKSTPRSRLAWLVSPSPRPPSLKSWTRPHRPSDRPLSNASLANG